MTLSLFLLSSSLLLVMPGPTNALLCVAGTLERYSEMILLLSVQAIVYAISLSIFQFILLSSMADNDGMIKLLRLSACALLFFVAFRLWNKRQILIGGARVIAWKTICLATLFNPKVLVFAFGILPAYANGIIPIAIVSSLSLVTGAAWFTLGSMLGPHFGSSTTKFGAGFLLFCGIALAVTTLRI